MSTERIFNDFVKYAEDAGLFIEGIAVADENKVLMEHRFTMDKARNIYSHTKSYTSTAVGIAIAQGKMDLSDRLVDYFPECVPENADERLYKITLRNLLTMSSGFGKQYLMGASRRAGVGFPDYVAYMMQQPMENEPGERFQYSTADSILTGRMVAKATGMRLGEFMYQEVFSKLGMGWPQWECEPAGHQIGGGGLFLKLTDMMKIGQLYLADGMWQGQRIVEHDWVKAATTTQIKPDPEENRPGDSLERIGYGYKFWMSPYPNAYRATGSFGQMTQVLPEKGLVIAVQCPEGGNDAAVKLALHERFFSVL